MNGAALKAFTITGSFQPDPTDENAVRLIPQFSEGIKISRDGSFPYIAVGVIKGVARFPLGRSDFADELMVNDIKIITVRDTGTRLGVRPRHLEDDRVLALIQIPAPAYSHMWVTSSQLLLCPNRGEMRKSVCDLCDTPSEGGYHPHNKVWIYSPLKEYDRAHVLATGESYGEIGGTQQEILMVVKRGAEFLFHLSKPEDRKIFSILSISWDGNRFFAESKRLDQ